MTSFSRRLESRYTPTTSETGLTTLVVSFLVYLLSKHWKTISSSAFASRLKKEVRASIEYDTGPVGTVTGVLQRRGKPVYRKGKKVPGARRGEGGHMLPTKDKDWKLDRINDSLEILELVWDVGKRLALKLLTKDLKGQARTQGWSGAHYRTNILRVVGVHLLTTIAESFVASALNAAVGSAERKLSKRVVQLDVPDPEDRAYVADFELARRPRRRPRRRKRGLRFESLEERASADRLVDLVVDVFMTELRKTSPPSSREVANKVPALASERILYGEDPDSVLSEVGG
jgi:hypothetical protein